MEVLAIMLEQELKKYLIAEYVGLSAKGLYNNIDTLEEATKDVLKGIHLNTRYYRSRKKIIERRFLI